MIEDLQMNKTIEDRAHDILLKILDVKDIHKVKTKESACIIAENVWNIVDAMHAEAEKRKGEIKDNTMNDFEVDWSQIPRNDVVAWKMKDATQAIWVAKDNGYYLAPSFNYQGDWRDSIRERPHD